jgi:ATP-dependent protease ClpP protease subunit/phage major head subunit gpT-like protein
MMNEILLYGTVGSSFWDEEYFTAKMVRDQIRGMSGPLTVRINSGGGIATEGQAIYTALRSYDGPVDVVIEGVAASAASLIAMAGDTITMTTGSILMIHDPATWYTDGRGTEEDHLHTARALGIIANAYAGIYAKRAGLSVEAAREIMKAETYFDGPAALEAGFATAIDDEADEIAPAAFDYRIYRHAPKRLLSAAGALVRNRPRETVLAMLAGAAITRKNGGHPMRKSQVKAATAAEEEDEEMLEEEELRAKKAKATEDEDEPTAEEDEDEPTAEGDEDEDEPMAEEDEDEPKAKGKAKAKAKARARRPAASGAVATQIIDLCTASGQSMATARNLIAKGYTLAQAVRYVSDKAAKEKPVTAFIRPGAPTARITRDERDTARIGMEGALVAQMSGAREVKGPARDYMTHSIVDMAAASIGHRDPIRSAGDRLDVIRMALGSNSTSDFPAVFENALNKRMLDAYENAPITYRAIAQRMDFTDFRPHPISAIGDFPGLQEIGETGEIKAGSTSDKKEVLQLKPFGRQMIISRQMLVNDDLGAIDRLLASRGRAVAAWEEQYFYAMMLSGANADGVTLLETTRQVFNTTDGTKAAAAAAIVPTSIALGYKALRERKGIGADAAYLNLTPAILLTGPAKEFEALQLLAPIQAAQASNVNPYSGKLQQVTSPYITGNAWYMFADPADAPVFAYGYLSGEEGPRMRMDEPFGTQGVAYSIEEDFGVGAVDFRGGYKNAGA